MSGNVDVLDSLVDLLQARMATKAVTVPPNAVPPHGPNGLMSAYGVNPDVFSAMPMPNTLESMLPAFVSNYANEVFGILTGQTAGTGDEWDSDCDDCVTAGRLKICRQTFPFGAFCTDSESLNITDVGELLNRSEPVDFRLINNPLDESVQGTAIADFDPREALNNAKDKLIFEMFNEHIRRHVDISITGSPANNNAAGYKEYNGLQALVNTGYRDTYTNVVCPAADPRLINFNASLTGSEAALVNLLSDLYYDRVNLARQLRMNAVRWAFVMRFEVFNELAKIWPCTYFTANCVLPTGGGVNVDAVAQRQMRDAMKNGSYLLIDGVQVPVMIDDTIPETIATAGAFRSDIYLVPTYAGSTPLLFWQHRDTRLMARFSREMQTFATAVGSGMHLLVFKSPVNTCIQYQVKTFKRLILRAPFLAARVQNVTVTPTFHSRSAFPTDSYYFVNGGNTSSPAPYFYPFTNN